MALPPYCDACGYKFLRDISKFCANCGEKRMVQEAVEEDEDFKVDDEGRMREPPVPVALQEKSVNTLSYMQIFAPPAHRKHNKTYGKKALVAAKEDSQHRIMLNNYEQVKKWLVDAQEVGRLPQGAFNLEEEGMQERLREIIKENCPTLQELKLGSKKYKWDEREVYKFLKKHLKYLRRKKRISENLTRNEVIEGQEINDVQDSSPVEENRNFLLMDTVQQTEIVEPTHSEGEGEGHVPEMEPTASLEDDEAFLLVVLSLPTIDVMKKHLRKVMEELNAQLRPKPFGKDYQKWSKEKQVREVAKHYRSKM